jgi:hypothetical protein
VPNGFARQEWLSSTFRQREIEFRAYSIRASFRLTSDRERLILVHWLGGER